MELVSTLGKNATKPNSFEIIHLQTTRKENNWKIKENLERQVVNLETRTDQRGQSLMFMMIIIIYTLQHVKQNNILATEKYGFRNSSSTEKVSFKQINEVLTPPNNQVAVGGIFRDLEKTLDSVNHYILLYKYEFYVFRGKTNAMLLT